MQNSGKMRIAVLVSGGGTNLQSLIDAQESKFFNSTIELVISNNKDAYGLTRAKNRGIPYHVIVDDENILQLLKEYNIDIVVLAGYLKVIGSKLINEYRNKIINIHPSLLPKYGGMGMYGLNVHKAVFENGDIISGATVHFVNEEVDGGNIILSEEISIKDCKSAEEIQKRVLTLEHKLLKSAVKKLEEISFEKGINKCN